MTNGQHSCRYLETSISPLSFVLTSDTLYYPTSSEEPDTTYSPACFGTDDLEEGKFVIVSKNQIEHAVRYIEDLT